MKLCVDVGNTTIGLGFYENDNLAKKIILNTDVLKLEDEYYSSISFLCKQREIDFSSIDYIIYSSVVPSLNESLRNVFSSLFKNAKIYDLGSDSALLKMDIDNPKEVGSDLFADLIGAKNKYQAPLIVIDLGTATKLLLLDKDETFTSALIMPGLKVSSDSLFKKAALLPEVDLSHSTNVLDSKNTNDCIKHGIIFGHIESILGLCARYENMLGYKLKKIVTGGATSLIEKHLPEEYIVDNSLTLDGELFVLNHFIKKENF